MIIKNNAERLARRAEKVNTLLRFLWEDTYSNADIFMDLLKFKTHSPLYRLLASLEDRGLILKHIFEAPGGKVSLWGITMNGIAAAIGPDDKLIPPRFEPSKITGWGMQHHILNQQVRLILESQGATGWINGDRKHFLTEFNVKHRPDGVVTLANGHRVAIETERNLKTPRRYQEIMKSHLVARTAEKWRRVYYVLPDEQKKMALTKIFDGIAFLNFGGRPIAIEQKHRDVFRFFTLEELKAATSSAQSNPSISQGENHANQK
jgi:hypothetical protein